MRRKLLHILPIFSLVLATIIGTWLVFPHDICLSKLIADSGCVCVPDTTAKNSCACYAKSSTAGESHCNDGADAENKTKSHAPGCFSISSDSSHNTGPERAPVIASALAVIAVLPLPVTLNNTSETFSRYTENHHQTSKKVDIHRDNCVFLI